MCVCEKKEKLSQKYRRIAIARGLSILFVFFDKAWFISGESYRAIFSISNLVAPTLVL